MPNSNEANPQDPSSSALFVHYVYLILVDCLSGRILVLWTPLAALEDGLGCPSEGYRGNVNGNDRNNYDEEDVNGIASNNNDDEDNEDEDPYWDLPDLIDEDGYVVHYHSNPQGGERSDSVVGTSCTW